jgi:flagellar hook assembly protein FlgD
VRAATVTASVVGPDKTAILLSQAAQQPGTYTFTWDAKNAAEGDWKFQVSDGTTTAERPFSVNNTLGAVNVTGTTVGFDLTHAADVTVTVENARGITVATLLAKKLPVGSQRVTWKGAPGSGYRVHVAATNSIGTVEQIAPFGSRR